MPLNHTTTSQSAWARRALTSFAILAAAVLSLLAYAAPGHASGCGAAVEWTGKAGDHQWTSAANWSTSKQPEETQTVCIGEGAGAIVVSGTTTAAARTVQSRSPLKIEAGAKLSIRAAAGLAEQSDLNGVSIASSAALAMESSRLNLTGTSIVDGEIQGKRVPEDEVVLESGALSGTGTIVPNFKGTGGTLTPGGTGTIGTMFFTSAITGTAPFKIVVNIGALFTFSKVNAVHVVLQHLGTTEVEGSFLGGYNPIVKTHWHFLETENGECEPCGHGVNGFTVYQTASGAMLERSEAPAKAPTVTTEVANPVATTTATVTGTVDPNESKTTACKFEYGPTASYGTSTSCDFTELESKTFVIVQLKGLTPGTEYHYRLSATNAGGTSAGADMTFATLAEPPVAVTEPASSVSPSSATLGGTVNPNGAAVTGCEIQYGTDPHYGLVAPCEQNVGSGHSPVSVSAHLTGLTAGTTYHFRVLAITSAGEGAGADLTFTTATSAPGGGVSERISSGLPSSGAGAEEQVASEPAKVEELELGCTGRQLVLNDVYIHAGRVQIEGSAAKSLVGRKVTVLFNEGRAVATAIVQAGGQYRTSAPLPPARIREALTTRYTAEIGALKSLHLKLTRRLQLEPPRASGTTVTLTGSVTPPLTRPIAPVVVEQQLECGRTTIAKRFTPAANGRFKITLTVPANARAAIYRLTSSVAASAHSTAHGFQTFSLPLPATLDGTVGGSA